MLAKFAPQAASVHSGSSGSSSEAVPKPRASELTRVFNIVNEAKESGITLEAAGGARVLPVLDALVREGRVRRVFDMMQVRFSTIIANTFGICTY
jgi:isopentenyl diphosphate isomerase/L-lactate dehydrogenase-like FMN-dependent dehydrogenase